MMFRPPSAFFHTTSRASRDLDNVVEPATHTQARVPAGVLPSRGRSWWFGAIFASIACADAPSKTDSADPGTTTPEATAGLPDGSSTWTGSAAVDGVTFLLDLSLENTGGDLAATATLSDDPEAPVGIGSLNYTLTGTHEPVYGRVALAPDDWVGEPNLQFELLGATAWYDPEARSLTGMIVDYASGADNTLAGGAFEATLTVGDGAPTVVGDRGRALSGGSQHFAGTMRCTSAERDVEGTLDEDGEGGLFGSLTVGDPGTDTPLGTFSFSAIHNPTTGGLTLVPGLWVAPEHDTQTFFVDGAYNPDDGSFEGDVRTNINACPDNTWSVTVD